LTATRSTPGTRPSAFLDMCDTAGAGHSLHRQNEATTRRAGGGSTLGARGRADLVHRQRLYWFRDPAFAAYGRSLPTVNPRPAQRAVGRSSPPTGRRPECDLQRTLQRCC
jgi:hypothetical protein